jgi:hypothetical protein
MRQGKRPAINVRWSLRSPAQRRTSGLLSPCTKSANSRGAALISSAGVVSEAGFWRGRSVIASEERVGLCVNFSVWIYLRRTRKQVSVN